MLKILAGVLNLHYIHSFWEWGSNLLDKARVLLDLLNPLSVIKLIKLNAAFDTSDWICTLSHVPLGIFVWSKRLM
jgi:hypothetical protein